MLRNSANFLAPMLALLLIAGCGSGEKETGPDTSPSATVPQVAASEPPVTTVPPSQSPLASFDRINSARNGKISSAEYAQAAQTLFEMMDMEHDGNLSVTELDAGAVLLAQSEALTTAKLMEIADNDNDGKLTLSEWMAFSNAHFSVIDINHDEMIDRAEWDAPHPPPS